MPSQLFQKRVTLELPVPYLSAQLCQFEFGFCASSVRFRAAGVSLRDLCLRLGLRHVRYLVTDNGCE
ncbi:hypothetical protein WI29_29390 [Burkholderia ubonensis]|nr:hypothetical protein WI31_23230 [Burkholderia ubonensis]KUZ11985.1 hypothetical protein WI29_29390 [Burkholderia ubonensis]KUZ35584.1 hypothetical protein WI30_10740 [Burkholderia ubonensis]KUZ39107.1 hypothetical protein WI32_10775 [Burkholderia ubonensis]KUZ45572.1 hypothetical protein WI33_26510 [Burkholderia ubonensis]